MSRLPLSALPNSTTATRRFLYKCDDCKTVSAWEEGWSWYGSIKDWDDGEILPTYCPSCTAKRTEA